MIITPEKYQGELGIDGSSEQNPFAANYIVNGMINKVDGNFLNEFMISKLADTGIFLGPYPDSASDVDSIEMTGAKAVINLQTVKCQKHRGTNTVFIDKLYRQKGISNIFNIPIDEHDESQVNDGLLEGAMRLNQLLNEAKLKVYIHDTSSCTRAPSAVLVYLCLFVKDKNYATPEIVAQMIKQHHQNSFPNMYAVNQTILANKHIQDQIVQSM